MIERLNISMIAAVAANGVIGNNNNLIWHYPKDLRRFRHLTTKAGIVIMGRKTHESIGKLLPNRINIVLTHQTGYVSPHGAMVYHTKNEALNFCRYFQHQFSEIIIIGGEQIYKEFLPHATQLYITNINAPYIGDAYFPDINVLEWVQVDRQPQWADDKHQFPYSFDTFARKI